MHKDLQRIRHGYYDLWFGTNAVYERWAKSCLLYTSDAADD